MIPTSILVLSTCALASAVAHPYQYGAWNLLPNNGFNFPNLPQFGGNFPQPWFPPIADNGPWTSTEDGKYKIVTKAEGYEIEDMKVKIKDGSIILRGDVMGGNSKSFSYSVGMPDKGNANEATAVYTKNGYLIVTVPLTGSAGHVERVVPITQSSDVYNRNEN